MIVRVLDQGHGFELTEIPDPLAEENLLRTSGRGLFLMRAFMDDFKVGRGPEGGAELTMIKKLPQPVSGNGKRHRSRIRTRGSRGSSRNSPPIRRRSHR